MDKVKELFLKKEYSKMLDVLEMLSPKDFRSTFVALANSRYEEAKEDVFEILHDNLTKEEWQRFKGLDSSEREREYILSKEVLSDEDYQDLRACDFE